MPEGERETHPHLHLGNIPGATRLILGSFPVYECTDCDSPKKENMRRKDGGVRFFYGSGRSKFWEKYHKYVDDKISRTSNPGLIIQSLKDRFVGISDTIISCERKDYSSSDSDLFNKEWNTDMLQNFIKNGVTKILCTSQGVLNALETEVICNKNNPIGAKDEVMSIVFQMQFIDEVGGNNQQVVGEKAKVFNVGENELYALSIPSPGSPQRRIFYYGCNEENGLSYAERYFEKAFDWLMS